MNKRPIPEGASVGSEAQIMSIMAEFEGEGEDVDD